VAPFLRLIKTGRKITMDDYKKEIDQAAQQIIKNIPISDMGERMIFAAFAKDDIDFRYKKRTYSKNESENEK
jgi:hypothetical protein